MADPEIEPSEPSYEIGYGRPPKATQFKPGQSGNRKGRPKGAQNFSKVLDKELNSLVPVTENGRRKNVRKKEVIAKQLVNKAAQGDLKATSILLSEARASESVTAAAVAPPASFGREDQLVLDSILARLRRSDAQQSPRGEGALGEAADLPLGSQGLGPTEPPAPSGEGA